MKVYSDLYGVPEDEKSNEFLLKIKNFLKENEQNLTEEDYGILVAQVHNELREKLNLKNKVFTIGTYKDGTKAAIIYFPKEPDGKYYKVHKDENGIYIIVENI